MIDVSNEANWNIRPTLSDKKTTLNLDRRKENLLSKIPELENCQSADILVALTDKIISNNYGQRKNPGERKMLCTKTAVVLKVLADLTGTWEADFPEISEINYFRGVNLEDSFNDHTPIILKNKSTEEKYIVDLTFSQFIDPKSKEIVYKNANDEKINTDINSADDLLVKELLVNGYVNYDRLDDYLNLMVKPEARIIRGQEFWNEYYNQMEMESFSSESDIDIGCMEIEKYLEEKK